MSAVMPLVLHAAATSFRLPSMPISSHTHPCPAIRTVRSPGARTVLMALSEQEERVSQAMEIKSVTETSPRATGLALALDDGTRKSHSVAENTAFVTGFFRGIATKTAFSQLVASLYFVYQAMEDEFDRTA